MSYEEYGKLVKKASKGTKMYKTIPSAFLIGGIICTIGEIFRLWFVNMGMEKDHVGMWVSTILIFITAVLTGFGIFHKIAKFGGAGTFVPITGFANSVVSPALEFQVEGFVLGVSSKMFIIAGPVIVYGTIASIAAGIVFYIITLCGGTI
ncbi:MAG: SpoVA/SpoVAEb family sporulation membrane protein [Oscillospiraceae bacterium]|nr:SpoVA/SpoVAEb family sporulation membrane protein [Oscillospiraceae bacterium]MDE5852795.1 SpoVA/SpoVAEb family sporulation membrane protein [Oscillospiraceae bacterium]